MNRTAPRLLMIITAALLFSASACRVSNTDCELFDGTCDGLTTWLLNSGPAPVISNVRSGGRLRSGFLRGAMTGNAASVQILLDGTIAGTATGVQTWTFQMPTGSAGWRLNSTHTITARALSMSGGILASTTITVRKGRNMDINGDGFADLLVGASAYNGGTANQGRAYIFHGSSDGIASMSAASANSIITGEVGSGGNFGFEAGRGDINGDGYGDMAVSAFRFNAGTVNQGRVYVFLGSSSGINIVDAASANAILTGEVGLGGQFGIGLDLGDFNGDGFDDIAAGASSLNAGTANQGRVYLFNGSASGIATANAAAAAAQITGETGVGGTLGNTLKAHDLNRDGFTDLIIAGSNMTAGTAQQGRVYLFNGSASGIATANAATGILLTGESVVGGLFGRALAAGDINGDGYGDIIATSASINSNDGKVYIFQGSASGFSSINAASASAILTGEPGSAANLGQGIGVGDANGDGLDDLLAGAYIFNGGTAQQGRGYFFRGVAGGIASASVTSANLIIDGENGQGGRFGGNITFTDLNGDGFEEPVVGAFFYNSQQGRAYALTTSLAGPSATNASQAGSIFTGESGTTSFGELVR